LALEKVDPEKPGTFSASEISRAELSEFFDKPEISKEATMQEVIQYAIGEEQDAFAFYKSLTEYAADETLINLLNRLATEEKRHKGKLERMYDDMFQPEN
jgi:rubrerythrin